MKNPQVSIVRNLIPALIVTLFTVAPLLQAQHPAITLYDKNFDTINPVTGENADKPFSTENTCGSCHDYETITSGYHFQMGWNKVSDEFGVKQKRPWSLSPGFMGKWYPYAFRQLAKKKNASPDEIDMTVYEFVGFSHTGLDQPSCGACHPGGGGLEHDRDGNRYDDHLRENPKLRESLDGDYYKSHWDASGVVEADCFLCHLAKYNFNERVSQLEMGNYQWAVAAATGLGIVEGAVKDGEKPKIIYNRRFFNEDGTYTPPVTRQPPSQNCLFCHSTSDVKKRGLSWNDIQNPDIHSQRGLECVACHSAGLDHQIAKGDEDLTTVASELDNSMKDCEGCHSIGYMAATIPAHRSVRPSHLKTIACEFCHVPRLNRAAAAGFEASTGKLSFWIRPADAEEFGAVAEWKPVGWKRADGKIYPYNTVQAVWWGNLDEDGILYPLFLREHAAAWKLYKDAVTDDTGDGKPEVNKVEEIAAGLRAFAKTIEGNHRFQRIHPVLVKGGKAYHFDNSGKVGVLDYDVTGLSKVSFPVSHVVAPPGMALGANGCQDCHDRKAHFATGQRVLDPYGPDGKPVTENIGLQFGCNPIAFNINAFHQEMLSPYVGVLLMLVIFLIVIHYHSYGPKRIPFEPFSHEVKRFSLLERGVHLLRLIAFVILAFTGIILAFNLSRWQELFFRSPSQMLNIHIAAGIVFIITTVMGIKIWFKDALFADYDKDWVRILGGYLGYKGQVPAGRFNAGQKMFYWYTTIFGVIMSITGVMLIYKGAFSVAVICLTSTVHNLTGFILIAGVVSHAYLGTIANPGTWRVLVDGYVTRKWAEHHHPFWYHEVVEKREKAEKEKEQDSDSTQE